MELRERRQPIEPPQVAAWLDDPLWIVWCSWCRAYHSHGLPLGHRTAHCASQGQGAAGESPFAQLGYRPVVLSVAPAWLRKDRRRRRPSGPPAEVQAQRPDLFALAMLAPQGTADRTHAAVVLPFKPRSRGRRTRRRR